RRLHQQAVEVVVIASSPGPATGDEERRSAGGVAVEVVSLQVDALDEWRGQRHRQRPQPGASKGVRRSADALDRLRSEPAQLAAEEAKRFQTLTGLLEQIAGVEREQDDPQRE